MMQLTGNTPEIQTREEGMEFTAEEQAILATLDQNLQSARSAKLEFLREAYKNRGEIAPTLEGLKSRSGKPFVLGRERELTGMHGCASTIAKIPFPHQEEAAYLCRGIYQEEDLDSCGWVKGDPQEVPYNNIGILGGSAGSRYYCRICGKQIGEDRQVMSLHSLR